MAPRRVVFSNLPLKFLSTDKGVPQLLYPNKSVSAHLLKMPPCQCVPC